MKPPKWNQVFLVSAVIQVIGKEMVTNKYFKCLQTSNQPVQQTLNSQWQGSEELQGSSQSFLLIGLEKHLSRLGTNLFQS